MTTRKLTIALVALSLNLTAAGFWFGGEYQVAMSLTTLGNSLLLWM